MRNNTHNANRRAVERAYRRAVRRGNTTDAGWLASVAGCVTEPAPYRSAGY